MSDDCTPDETARPFVFIEWWDSREAHGWIEPEEADLSPAVCRSVGWIVKETDEYIALAGTWSPSIDEVTALLAIPKGCIRLQIDLVWPDGEKPRGADGSGQA